MFWKGGNTMETFSVKFKVGSLDLNVLVRAFDHLRQFKVEMVTNEPRPILINRSAKGEWQVIEKGERRISDQEFEELEKAIETELHNFYSVKHMLALTDFSDTATNACKYAAALSQQLKTSKLTLYHSYESILLPPSTFAPVGPGFAESAEQSHDKLTHLKMELDGLVGPETTTEIRNDERTLVTAVNMLVQQHHTGLVVVGISGKGILERALIGSNTIDLAKACMAPLLIIPPVARFKKIEKVIFACDLRKVSQSTPAYAIKTFVNALGASLLILNVDRNGNSFNPDTIGEISALHALWDDQQPEYHYTDHEDTVKGIMEFADQQQADLVITAPKAYGFIENILHSSLTKKLAYHTHLPLLLFREEV